MAKASKRVEIKKEMIEVEKEVVVGITLELTMEEAATIFLLAGNVTQHYDPFKTTLKNLYYELQGQGFKSYMGKGVMSSDGFKDLDINTIIPKQ